MRILADTNVFIDFWKQPTQSLIDTFSSEDGVICVVVKSELLHGARSEKDMKRIREALDGFEELIFEESDWEALGIQLYKLRTNGLTVPFQDAIIALLAVKYDLPVWTNDKHFLHLKNVMPDLQLY